MLEKYFWLVSIYFSSLSLDRLLLGKFLSEPEFFLSLSPNRLLAEKYLVNVNIIVITNPDGLLLKAWGAHVTQIYHPYIN